MEPIGFHANFALADRRVISLDVATHRRAALGVLRAARPFDLLAFRIADTHAHVLVAGPATEVVRRVKIALHQAVAPASGFGPTHYEPVLGQAHLDRAFHYVLRQATHHGFGHDPHAEASNLPDLLGLRTEGIWTAGPVRRWLPRVGRPTLLAILGVDELEARPVPVDVLADAALAAAGLFSLAGRGAEVVAARTAAIHAADRRAANGEVARALGISVRTLQALRAGVPDPSLVRAVQLQGDLRRQRPPDTGVGFVGEPDFAWEVAPGAQG